MRQRWRLWIGAGFFVLLLTALFLFGTNAVSRGPNLQIACELPDVPDRMPVYRLERLDQQGCISLGMGIGEALDVKFDSISYKPESTMFLGTDRSGRAHMLVVKPDSSFSYSSPKPASLDWQILDREAVVNALVPFGLAVPSSAAFSQEDGDWHSFSVHLHFQQDALITGSLRCRISEDGILRELEQALVKYTQVGLTDTASQDQIRSALAQTEQADAVVTGCRLAYVPQEDAYVPVYRFELDGPEGSREVTVSALLPTEP